MASKKFNYEKDREHYSNAASDIADKLEIKMIDYNLFGRYLKNNKDVLSGVIDDCVKYSAYNPSLSSNIGALVKNHLARKNYLRFLTEEGKYSHPLIISESPKSKIERISTPTINRMSPKTLLTEMTL